MSRLVKNNTTASVILDDLFGAMIVPNDYIDLDSFPDINVRTSFTLISAIINGNLTYSDGAKDFAPNDALNLIRGYQQIFNTTSDGKQITIPSNRPNSTYAYFTGTADDVAGKRIGKGTPFMFDVPPGQTISQTLQFTEMVYFMGANAYFQNAEFGSYCDMTVWAPKNTPLPADGKGNFDMDANGVLTANPTMTGSHYVFPVAVPVTKFVNNFLLLGDQGQCTWDSPDVARLFEGWCMKMTFTNVSVTKNLKAVINVNMYRVHSI